MATMDEIRKAGLRESTERHANDAGMAAGHVAQEGGALLTLGGTVYGAVKERDFARLTVVVSSLRRHHAAAGERLAELERALEALAAAELGGRDE